ncbi:MAG TPA: hypothetical protein VMO26_01680 [Vicinamibacterales bacterium]|nr:hypothetical protein [Vicinamibacterales bacterium]
MALEDRIRSSVDTALGELTARLDKDVRAMVQQLVTVALEERDEALTIARGEAIDQAAAETRRQLDEAAVESRRQVDEVAADTQRQIDEAEARVRATLDETIAEARAEERARAASEARELIEAEAGIQLHDAMAAAETRMTAALAEADARAELRLRERVIEAQVVEREAEMAALTRLLESVRGLDGAASLSEVLDALGQATGREASRAAVFVLRNDRLIGWKLTGFGAEDARPKSLDLGFDESGVIGQAVGTARPVTTRGGHAEEDGPGFAQLPADRLGFAVPVIVGGRVVAVVYADSVTSEGREHVVPSGWPEVIEILSRHAARCLEALSVQKAAGAPSPRFRAPGAARPAAAAEASPSTPASEAQASGSDVPPDVAT